MAQNREHIYIAAPGFKGLNTQDSPVAQDATFAAIAENMVIDKYGRIGARQGLNKLTTSATPLGSSIGIESIFEYVDHSGDKVVFSAGNNKVFTGTTTLTDVTPGSYTVSANNWKIINFNDHAYFWQRGHEPLIYTDHGGSGTLEAFSSHGHATGTPPQANEALAAFGRVWAADVTGNKHTVYWSDLLSGHTWTGGTSGSLDITTVWPTGHDEIVALSEFNDFLVIFGKRSIILYSGASSPSTMVLADVITNIGCIARDSVQSTGSDLLFLSDSGVRSLGRVIQEKSNPIGDVSINVRDDLVQAVSVETGNIKSVYSEENAFYLLILPTVNNLVFCFDMRGKLENGANRVTTWPFTGILCATTTDSSDVYFGNSKGINRYFGFLDDTSTYTMKYYTNALSFGDASKLKILKEITFTIVGGQGTDLLLNWGYDYTEGYTKQLLTVDDASIAEYGLSEYNVATSQYNASIIVNKATTKATGSGRVVTIGLDATINDKSFSIQDVNIEAFIGRTI
jgi:hypothetical protein